ncbi:MAG: response regulator [Chloroherpetonaceae bacterium]|nr:response regulator [Chloroherpetonaceae bacterium]MCS7210333.1 response regulator [Chloroherpetonaceae bacterium]MDW8019072.1 response regulator [Chloroherpetonaceae bacterium]
MTELEMHHLLAIQRALLREDENCLTEVACILSKPLNASEVAIYELEPHNFPSQSTAFRCNAYWSADVTGSRTKLFSLLETELTQAALAKVPTEQHSKEATEVILPFGDADEVLGCLRFRVKQVLHNGAVQTALLQSALEALSSYIKRKRMDTALLQMQAELEALRQSVSGALRAKSVFLASISHEIRTPMNIILGMCDLLLDTPLSAEQTSYLNTLRSAGNTLATLLTDLIDFSNLESGKLELKEQPFVLIDLLQHVASLAQQRATEKQLRFTLSLSPALPNTLLGDALRIQQILMNLLSNAIKFTEQGAIELRAELERLDEATATICFSVIDTGIGISPEKLDFIFEQFAQVEQTTARKHGGVGLGLTIAKQLVERMNGTISVESALGKGSRFEVRLPLRLAPESAVPKSPLAGRAALLIDRDSSNQSWFKNYFASRNVGLNVATHLDAVECVRLFGASCPFSWVLVNCHLPEMELHALTHALMKTQSAAPAVIFFNARRKTDLWHLQHIPNAKLLNTLSTAELDAILQNHFVNHTQNSMQPVSSTMLEAPESISLKILVADDARDNQLLIKAFFKKQPFEVCFASNGYEALAQFKAQDFDLVLMDLQMPDLDGYAATAAIRQWERETKRTRTPIIALTAFALEEKQARALEAGCDAYLTKPIKKEALLQMIYTHCSRYAENHRAY